MRYEAPMSTSTSDRATFTPVVLLIVAACIVLGLLGLVLPIIPGLLLLALAAVLVARRSPAVRHRLSRHDGIRRCLDEADRVLETDTATRIKLGLLYAARAAVEGTEIAVQALARLLRRWRDQLQD